MEDKNIFEQFIKTLRQIRLTKDEKSQGRMELIDFIKQHQMTPVLARSGFWWWFQPKRYIPVSLIIVFIAGSGITLAAQNSLPGDFLFPIKTSVNENVEIMLAGSVSAKAQLNAQLAQRRLEEVELLAAQGQLSAKAKVQAENNFNERTQEVIKNVDEAKSNGLTEQAIEVSSDLESSLKAHEAILSSLTTDKNAATVKRFVENIRSRKQDITSTRQAAEVALKVKDVVNNESAVTNPSSLSKISSGSLKEKSPARKTRIVAINRGKIKNTAEAKSQTAEAQLGEVRKLYEDNQNSIGETASANTKESLNLAQQALNQANGELGSSSYEDAFILFQKVDRLTREAKIIINASKQFKIDIIPDKESSRSYQDNERKNNPRRKNNSNQNDD